MGDTSIYGKFDGVEAYVQTDPYSYEQNATCSGPQHRFTYPLKFS